MHYSFPQKVLFKHCDPAGIVFYPRMFEMINDAVEALFSDVLSWPFEDMHPDYGVPTVAINVQFRAPCYHGEQLALRLTIKAVGGASLNLCICAVHGEDVRFEADQTLVCVGPNKRPTAWPEPVRNKINTLLEHTS